MTKANTTPPLRLFFFVVIVWLGFGLRLHDVSVPDLDIDESWTIVHSQHFVGPPFDRRALAIEPNNAFHIVLTSAVLEFGSYSKLGARLLSVFTGTLIIALAARIAGRISGRQAAYLTAIFVAVSFHPIQFSQIGRPYTLANFFALLSIVFWLERNWAYNLLASVGLVWLHIGAFPVIILQDAITLWQVLVKKRRVNRFMWLSNRFVVYMALGAILFMLHLRRVVIGKVISQGQQLLTPDELLANLLNGLIYDPHLPGRIPINLSVVLMILGVLLPSLVGLLYIFFWQEIRWQILFPLLWVVLTYGILLILVVTNEGALLVRHISHVTVALALFVAIILDKLDVKLLTLGVMLAFIGSVGLTLPNYYDSPYMNYTNARKEFQAVTEWEHPIYLRHPTALWVMQLNNPEYTDYFENYSEDVQYSGEYFYVRYSDWDPTEPPADCSHDPIAQVGGYTTYSCSRK